MKFRIGTASARAAAAAMVLALTACGGGGDERDKAADVDAGRDAAADGYLKSTRGNPVFAADAGPLCSTTVAAGICSQPTSSTTTMPRLLAHLETHRDVKVQFDVSDVAVTSITRYERAALVAASCRVSYVDQKVTVGHDAVRVGKVSRPFVKSTSVLWRYGADKNNQTTLGMVLSPLSTVTMTHATNGYVHFSDGVGSGETGGTSYTPYIGMLTDQSGMPSADVLVYDGYVSVSAGDCAVHQGLQAFTFGTCKVTLQLNTRTGVLKTTATKCSDSYGLSPTQVSFSMDPLKILGSRVQDAPANAARLRVKGKAMRVPTGFTVSASATATGIGGMLLNHSANVLIITGSAKNGRFALSAFRR